MAIIPYDELSMFHENAAEFGIPYDGPPVVRRTSVELGPDRTISALVWGDAPPELVLLHGGGQNAHTWDTVALALGRPLVAIDLPGHGHSDGAGYLSLTGRATQVEDAVRALAPDAKAVVGMSLGGLTTLALSTLAPELVRSIVLVDVLPTLVAEKGKAISDFIHGPPAFADFDEILQRTMQFNPTRSASSLRRGILHNAAQQPDGSWVWRHTRPMPEGDVPAPDPAAFDALWSAIEAFAGPLLLVRGMESSSVLDDAGEAELRTRRPDARIEQVVGAGHSIQGDKPVELAALIADFVPAG